MKALAYVISKKAVADLEEIWLYTVEKWSVAQADRYYNLIFDEINFICKNSNSGKSMEHVRKGYRASKVKSHLIFYRVSNNTIE
jgi:toxin ParE1/3/4